jgi:glutamate synthase (NADPH/NADH) large chain
MSLPAPRGLYHPSFEHDACGVGFVADVTGRASHQTVLDAACILGNLDHRAGRAADGTSGDGAGMLTAVPDAYFRAALQRDLGVRLAASVPLGVGNVFLPRDARERAHARRTFERCAARLNRPVLGWRTVPVDADGAALGARARDSMPVIEQLLISGGEGGSPDAFERDLFAIRKEAETALRSDARLRESDLIHVCSLSSRVIVFKGMLTPAQLLPFYGDLRAWDFRSHLAMVHSRFSTNTFPSWDRAQPMRWISHNGEINTLRGNVNAMRAREGSLRSDLFEEGFERLLPVASRDTSDSGSFDNVLELMLMSGRPLPEAIMMMIPEAWEHDDAMSAERRAFYEFASMKMEPWDGPASITFTDGRCIGAVLDRNGLRPSRYTVTHDDRVIMASEVGALPLDPSLIKENGRLEPGRMLLIDFDEQRLVPDEEIKARVCGRHPYGEWIARQRLTLPSDPPAAPSAVDDPTPAMRAFGFTAETLRFMLLPLVTEMHDPVGSMGDDAALACLSELPRSVFDYFRQLFAQVTNPPIDSTREAVVMSLGDHVGPEGALLDSAERDAARLHLPHPLLSAGELAGVRGLAPQGWTHRTLDLTRPHSAGPYDLEGALERLALQAEAAIDAGHAVLILSDRATGPDRVPIPVALAVGAVHQHLIRSHKRTRVALVVDTGEAREVHHFCVLLGYGADAIHPWLALEALRHARREGKLAQGDEELWAAYRRAVGQGILKVMAKMGISVLASYKGAQIFEAVGLAPEVIGRCFDGTASRLGGVGFAVLDREAFERHERGYPRRSTGARKVSLRNEGQLHWRAGGESHAWDPEAITALQQAAQEGNPEAYQRFSDHVQEGDRARRTLRGLLRFRPTTPIPLDEVEPAREIVRRFSTGAMSFGSLSSEAHTTLARAMNGLGGKSNSGEGGEDPARTRPLPDGSPNPLRSRIKQVASGRFGVTIGYLASADEIQIKMAQGAKPGEGGHLPGPKVNDEIARVRYSTPGVALISPPPHHDIYSIEDLAQLIFDLGRANPSARISVKLVSEMGVGTVAAGVVKAGAGHVLISGHDGGTGASPITSVKHAGTPWELGLGETHQTLVLNGLRSRVVLQVDGQLKTGRDVVIAALLGADEFGFATAPLITLGCVMMRKCHLNTCPVGIATQDPELRARFAGQPEHVTRYLFDVAEEARRIMAGLGFRSVAEMVGRVEVLEQNPNGASAKTRGLDLSQLLTPAHLWEGMAPDTAPNARPTEAPLLDRRIIELARPALEDGLDVRARLPIRNVDRAVGTLLSHEITRVRGEDLLPDGSVHVRLHGSAGQSFGAWLASGVTLELEGEANDYVGKGLSGGKIVIYPPAGSTFEAAENVIAGNVILYGATSGQAFIRGRVAERFCVRNSGAEAVVEGVGDHGCEYMTGGRVVILGPTGRNFAAGMSGGTAWVWDPEGRFRPRVNLDLVELERPDGEDDVQEVRELIRQHREWTGSTVADSILHSWEQSLRHFVRVMPTDYRRVLAQREAECAAASKGVA